MNTLHRETTAIDERPIYRRAAFWITCILVCHLLILLHFCQWYFYAILTHKTLTPRAYLVWSMEVWYVRAALAPLAIWLALRKRFEISHWVQCVTIYVFGSIAIALIGSALQAGALLMLHQPKALDGQANPSKVAADATWLYRTVLQGGPHTVYNIFTCWMLIGSVQSVMYYTESRKRQLQASLLESELSRMRLDVLRMQLKPHFLFNTLHSISALIHEEPALAESMLLQLSNLLRTSLRDDVTPVRTFQQELELLEWHLAIERTRFGDRLTTVVDVDPDVQGCAVPHLLLLPLIENAVEHGIGKNSGEDTVRIMGCRREGELHIEISNSNSHLRQQTNDKTGKGIGLSNTKTRLNVLYGEAASLELVELIPQGVMVHIRLPLLELNGEG